jgi:hypothetical protein
MPDTARKIDRNYVMKSLSKIGLMRQIATGIYHAEGLIFTDKCKVKTNVDRIELLARWSGNVNPPQHIRKQTLMGCGSMLYHLTRAFAQHGWSVEIQLFPKLDREDVIAYVRAGFRNTVMEDPATDSAHEPELSFESSLSAVPGQGIYENAVLLEKKVNADSDGDDVETWYFRTKDNDAIAWIRTGQMYAHLHRKIQYDGRITIHIPDKYRAGTSGMVPTQNGVELTDQLIVNVRV